MLRICVRMSSPPCDAGERTDSLHPRSWPRVIQSVHRAGFKITPKSVESRARLGPGWFWPEGPDRVALGSLCQGELALACQLFAPKFLVARTRQRREKRHEIVNLFLG